MKDQKEKICNCIGILGVENYLNKITSILLLNTVVLERFMVPNGGSTFSWDM